MEHPGSMEPQLSFPADQHSAQDESGPDLVAQPSPPGKRTLPTGTPVAHTYHGCQSPRLGRSPGTPYRTGNLDGCGSPPSDQYLGNQGGTPSSLPLAEPTHRARHQGPIGQRHHRRLPQSPRGHEESTGPQRGQPHSNVGRSEGSPPLCHLHSRPRKLASRLPQPTTDRSGGMGSEPRNIPRHRRSLGPSRGGPHGLPSQPQGDTIHVQMPRPPSVGSRRPNDYVGLRSRICLPASPSSSKGHQKDQIRAMHSHPDSSSLAKKSMVHRTDGSQQIRTVAATSDPRSTRSGTNPSSQSSLPEFDGVEIESIVLRRKGFSRDVIRTMMAARKPVSSKTYHRVWKTYRDWCENTGHSFQDLSVPRLLSFLQSGLDKGLSLGSLKSQISALSVLFQQRLAILPDVSTFIQGVAHICPPFREPLPPWDLNLVLSALQTPPFEPLATIPLAWLSWKTVFLLAIASARRVSEISALSSQPPYLIFHEDRAVLRTIPSFVPKVVSAFHINQDITVPSFCPNPASPKEVALHSLDPVRALKFYLHRTRDFRATTSLFVLHSGHRKGHQASKTTISRWIRETIRRAYIARGKSPPIHITAHSTRGIGSSWAFRNRASADQVCRAATWSSIHSFTKFYQFEIFAASDAHFGRKVLQAAIN
ncbi:hypothetical protein XENTR_v10006338 [Xenopus tropicalis]|nr:hypothetical protein XENTR_v10021668 [Xenopus tropicalis]KAE8625615.1 hypothetical protein XENTR_v10006338 [Xenopus tropicalis]